jgi:hypothetical protein
VEILGIPWAAAAIYAGWSGKFWLYVVLVFVGIVLYALIRQRAVISASNQPNKSNCLASYVPIDNSWHIL